MCSINHFIFLKEACNEFFQLSQAQLDGKEIVLLSSGAGLALGGMGLALFGGGGALLGVAFGILLGVALYYRKSDHEPALDSLREKLIEKLEELDCDQQKRLLLSEKPYLMYVAQESTESSTLVDGKTGERKDFVSRLEHLILDTDPEYRLQLATILVSKTPLSVAEMNSLIFFLQFDQTRERREAKERREPFEPIDYSSLRNVPPFEGLREELQERSYAFLRELGKYTSARLEEKEIAKGSAIALYRKCCKVPRKALP